MRKLFVILTFFFTICSFSFGYSLWDNASSYYVVPTAHKIGDIITIVINEQSSAVNTGGTRSLKQSDLKFDLGIDTSRVDSAGNVNERTQNGLKVDGSGDNRYIGRGQTSRSTRVQALISAQVVEVKPNGDLFIVGKRAIKINEEIETIQISGIIHPRDISSGNQIDSSKIAQANISIHGKGTVSAPQKPGLMSNIFNFLF